MALREVILGRGGGSQGGKGFDDANYQYLMVKKRDPGLIENTFPAGVFLV